MSNHTLALGYLISVTSVQSRLAKRRLEHPERASTDTKAMFEQVTKYFVEPSLDEGFNIKKCTGFHRLFLKLA